MGAEIIENEPVVDNEPAVEPEQKTEPEKVEQPEQQVEPEVEKPEDKTEPEKEPDTDKPTKAEDEAKEAEHKQAVADLEKKVTDTEADLSDVKAQLKKETTKAENLKEQVKTLEAVVSGLVDAKLADIPEEFKVLIPKGDAVDTLDWLSKAEEAGLFKKSAPAVEIGKPMQLGNPTDKADTEATAQQKLSNYFSNYFKK